MRKIFLLLFCSLLAMTILGRNLTELQEWREKGLPSQVKSGVQVEMNDLKKMSNDQIGVKLRTHNMSNKTISELVVKVWVWKDGGVQVEEIKVITDDRRSSYLNSGREEYFPSKYGYHILSGIKYSEMTKIQLEITRLVSKRVR